MAVLSRDVDDVKQKLASLSGLVTDLADLKLQVLQLTDRVNKLPNHTEVITKLQNDIRHLYAKLGVSGSSVH